MPLPHQPPGPWPWPWQKHGSRSGRVGAPATSTRSTTFPAGTTNNTFENLVERAATPEFLGCTIYVADLSDIIVSKEAADREKDREALPELRALQAARLAQAVYPEGIEAALGTRDLPSPPVDGPGRGPDYGREPPGRTLA